MMGGTGRCAIWHDGALGDLLISFPAMSFISSLMEECILLARGEAGRFVGGLLGTEQFVPSDSSAVAGVYGGELPPFFRGLDALFLFSRRPDSGHVAHFRRLFSRKLKVISTSPPRGKGWCPSLYEYQFLQVGKLLGVDTGGIASHIPRPAGKGERGLGQYYVVHPGSGGRAKCWPPERFSGAVERLRKILPDTRPKVVLGPCEEERLQDFMPLISLEGAEVVRGSNLHGLYELLKGARFYIGNDSGVSHLAAFVGIESFLLFGPTDPRVWAPPFPWVHVIAPKRMGAIEEIREEAVVEEILKTISSGVASP